MRFQTFLLLLLLAPGARSQDAPAAVDFVRDIQPIFKAHCLTCHGPEKQKGLLRLDSRTLALEGGLSGKVILPGNAKESPLVRLLIETRADERMPRNAEPLSAEKIEKIRAWIDQGATWPASASVADAKIAMHWAYVPPVRVATPAVRNSSWVRNPIDAFIAAAHEERGLKPRPEAPKHALLRRLHLDLIGLPPSREEVGAFLADASPDAYEKAVDRLLADPRHGERWGRHWMDVWRYSDWAGYGMEIRQSQRHIWKWRDWIVESLNADKGYDRMALEMIAGDELAPEDPAVLRATGFLARSWFKFNRNVWLDQIVEHTSKAFLATTMNCARCHSHFFDPISHDEYYRFRAFFEPHNVRTDHLPGQADIMKDGLPRVFDAEPAAPTWLFVRGEESRPDKDRPLTPAPPRALGGSAIRIEPVPLPRSAQVPELRDFVLKDLLDAEAKLVADARAKLDAAMQNIAKLEKEAAPALQAALEELPLAVMAVPLAEAKRDALAATIRAGQLPESAEAAAAQRHLALLEARRARFVAQRAVRAKQAGAQKKLDDAEKALAKAESEPPSAVYVKRKVPEYPATSTGRRLALARWIVDGKNPLAARVAVNQIWLRHFGKPLVPTVFDFGSHGRAPTHPALLDWLAVEFMSQDPSTPLGASPSAPLGAGWSMKKLHRLIVTSSAYRMDSTADAASLAADPDNRFLWRMNPRRMEAELVRDSVLHVAGRLDATRGGPELDHAAGLRRSLYYRHAPEKQMEMLTVFDAANVTECYERTESIVPHQALALSNSALDTDSSRLLARKLPTEDFVTHAFEQVLGRPPTEEERRECGRFLEEQARRLADPAKLTAFSSGAGGKVEPSTDPALRARENLVHVLFNHHEFVTIR